MQKPADTDHPIHDLLARRWSPRSFSDRAVEPEKVKRIFEAARWAASSYNEQPWRFIVAAKDEPGAFGKILSCLVEQNRAWAKDAPFLGITVAKETFTKNGKPNRVCEHDVGLAMGNLTIEAMALDLYVHQMAGLEPEKARETFDIPDGFHAFTAFAVGYMGEPEGLDADWMRDAEKAPRERMPLEAFIFTNTFGDTSPLVA